MIIILNGVPRSGKSSIAEVIVDTFPGEWINRGVDWSMREMTDDRFFPGIGLRPGGEKPEIESMVMMLYDALHKIVGDEARRGRNVVMDVGYHTWYAEPFDPYEMGLRHLEGLPVLFVGVKCPTDVIMQRRNATTSGYAKGEGVPEPVQRWQDSVHEGRSYDLEVDTSILTPEECANAIFQKLGI